MQKGSSVRRCLRTNLVAHKVGRATMATRSRGSHAASERTYESAMRIIAGRQRRKRPISPLEPASSERVAKQSGTPDLRGTPGIAGMSAWLQSLGHSDEDINRLNVIHVAGTKGKGSTCAFTESFLRAHGQRTGFPRKTGLYTSPHLIVPEERIRINSEPLQPDLFARYFFEVCDHLPQLAEEFDPTQEVVQRGPRYLQLFALLALHIFIREKVDVAVIETHSGGEYDATNIVQRPIATVITTLGMDHVDMLGPTIENIAWHKSGIFKRNTIALSAKQEPAPQKVLERRSVEKGVSLRFVDTDERLPSDALVLKPQVQKENASLAAVAGQVFLDKCSIESLTREDLANGISLLSWPGRFQTIREGQHDWYLDSAHNDMSVKVAAQWFAGCIQDTQRQDASHALGLDYNDSIRRAIGDISSRILIYSHINELRDAAALLESLGRALQANGLAMDHVIFSTYDESVENKGSYLKHDPEVFYKIWRAVIPHTRLWNEPTIQGAIALARRLDPEGTQTLITGSQHLVGPALRVLGWAQRSTV